MTVTVKDCHSHRPFQKGNGANPPPTRGPPSGMPSHKPTKFFAFLVLSVFLDLSTTESLIKKKMLISLLIAYALSIEVTQYFLPYRDAEFLDFLFDLLGILVYLKFAPKFKIGHQI